MSRIYHEHPAPERTLSENNHSMPISLNGRSWTILTLFLAGTILFLCSRPANAGQLLDVRIGEYDGFTRIVFEIDSPSAQPRIDIGAKGRLWVAFDHMGVNLVRKIPVKRSRHIKDIQFWHHGGHLSTQLKVDYPQYRFETFSLSNPPRVAVDIIPLALSSDTGQTVSTAAETPAPPPSESPVKKDDAPQHIPKQDNAQPAQQLERPTPQSADDAQRLPTDTAMDEAGTKKPILRSSDPDKETTAPLQRSPRRSTNRLQLFLVIGLVLITIGILFLLLMMLLARHRFSEVKSKLGASDFLREQDEKIDAINERIKEQFERYDKA
jgi:hypothetical protein